MVLIRRIANNRLKTWCHRGCGWHFGSATNHSTTQGGDSHVDDAAAGGGAAVIVVCRFDAVRMENAYCGLRINCNNYHLLLLILLLPLMLLLLLLLR